MKKKRKKNICSKKKRKNKNTGMKINQEVEGLNTADLAMSHIVPFNPIVKDSEENKNLYLLYLKNYAKTLGRIKRKYVNSELDAYKKILFDFDSSEKSKNMDKYKYFILFDLMHILGYDLKNVSKLKIDEFKEQYYSDFKDIDEELYAKNFRVVSNRKTYIDNIRKTDKLNKDESKYLSLIEENFMFREEEPFGILVTATMSAGKSTFINALVGKNICLSQNLACTSKIHSIVNKAYEDNYSYEYDHDLVMTAGKEELMNDNEQNNTNNIAIGTKLNGKLSESRIIINDSPGVNYSGNSTHKEITNKLIKRKNYNLLIYVMNATAPRTTDESEHLEYVKNTIGRTPILFVLNKVDMINRDEEDLEEIISRQKEYLEECGFKNPVICPVSARAGYLAKKFDTEELSRLESRELYKLIDDFEAKSLKNYYKTEFKDITVSNYRTEEKQLIVNSGLEYVEKIIKEISEKNKKVKKIQVDILSSIYEQSTQYLEKVISKVKVGEKQYQVELKQVDLNSNIDKTGKEIRRPLVCILNATQLATVDASTILERLAEENVENKRNILFALDKLDMFSPAEENIEETINKVRKYLKGFGFENPRIFPCSTYIALNIRTHLKDIDINNLTTEEEKKLPSAARETLYLIDKFNNFESMYLEKYSNLSFEGKREIQERLHNAERDKNLKEMALIHSGICSIEKAIEECITMG